MVPHDWFTPSHPIPLSPDFVAKLSFAEPPTSGDANACESVRFATGPARTVSIDVRATIASIAPTEAKDLDQTRYLVETDPRSAILDDLFDDTGDLPGVSDLVVESAQFVSSTRCSETLVGRTFAAPSWRRGMGRDGSVVDGIEHCAGRAVDESNLGVPIEIGPGRSRNVKRPGDVPRHHGSGGRPGAGSDRDLRHPVCDARLRSKFARGEGLIWRVVHRPSIRGAYSTVAGNCPRPQWIRGFRIRRPSGRFTARLP